MPTLTSFQMITSSLTMPALAMGTAWQAIAMAFTMKALSETRVP